MLYQRSTSSRLKTHCLIDVHRVDDADDHRVDRQVLGFGRQPGAGALRDQHELAFAGADGVDRHERAAGVDQRSRSLRLDAIRLDDQQFVADHRVDLLRGDQEPVTLATNMIVTLSR